MRNIREMLTVIFRDLGSQTLISEYFAKKEGNASGEWTEYNHLNTSLVINLMEQRLKRYSRSELEMVIHYLARDCAVMKEIVGGAKYWENLPKPDEFNLDTNPRNRGPLDIFDLITYYALQLVNIANKSSANISVRFEELLHWKDVSYAVSEDVLVSAAFARWDIKKNFKCRNQNWPVVLPSDYNFPKNFKMAENHCHFKGSGPAFLLTWPYLMNQFGLPDLLEKNQEDHDYKSDLSIIENMEKLSRNASYHVTVEQSDAPLLNQIYQAAAIRLYLYHRLQILEADEPESVAANLPNWMQDIDSLYQMLDKYSSFKQPSEGRSAHISIDEQNNLFDEIKSYKDCIHETNSEAIPKKLYDYALTYYDKKTDRFELFKDTLKKDPGFQDARLYEGERLFLYRCFRAVISNKSRNKQAFSSDEKQLFLIYLMIHQRFRIEFLQVNRDITGFENFDILESRKDIFLDHDEEASKKLIDYTFEDFWKIEKLKKLEVRIAPKTWRKILWVLMPAILNCIAVRRYLPLPSEICASIALPV